MTAQRSSITGGSSPPNTASELVKINFMPGARRRRRFQQLARGVEIDLHAEIEIALRMAADDGRRWNSTPQSASISRSAASGCDRSSARHCRRASGSGRAAG